MCAACICARVCNVCVCVCVCVLHACWQLTYPLLCLMTIQGFHCVTVVGREGEDRQGQERDRPRLASVNVGVHLFPAES